MASSRLPTLIATALLLAAPAIAQEPGSPAAPTLDGAYDGATSQLLLTWSPASGTPPGSEYTVLQEGIAIAATTELQFAVDLSGWARGLRGYEVKVSWPGGPTSGPSAPFLLAKDVELPPNCPVASVSVYTQPPGVQYEVYEDCLPE